LEVGDRTWEEEGEEEEEKEDGIRCLKSMRVNRSPIWSYFGDGFCRV